MNTSKKINILKKKDDYINIYVFFVRFLVSNAL